MPSVEEVRALGEGCPGEFFRVVVEALSDSFEPAQAAAYERLMRAWIPALPRVQPVVPERVDVVYVLSRVTLGSDIKIAGMVLDAMKRRFPLSRIIFVGGRKSAELFAADGRIEFLEANYPRSGPVSARLAFAEELQGRLAGEHRIVVDPDSRFTQLGLIPVCEPERYFHFPSRTAGGASDDNLSDLTRRWLVETFGQIGRAFIAPAPVEVSAERPMVAVSLGVGENESKRVGGDFETLLIRSLGERYATVWVDRGAGGEEARRVTATVEASGVADHIRFWEGSFAGFASVIAQSDFYVGYDSAGQHAAAASGVRSITVFAGAVSDRFRSRWSVTGSGVTIPVTDGELASSVQKSVVRWLPRTPQEIDALREQIRSAFPPVRFTGKATVCQCDECIGLAKALAGRRWDELPPELPKLCGYPTLLLPEAVRCFLPVWMLRAFEPGFGRQVMAESTLIALCGWPENGRAGRLAQLRARMTTSQIASVREWLLTATATIADLAQYGSMTEQAIDLAWKDQYDHNGHGGES
jgi:ADP-heptose:LPS heptosyltransferase